MKPLYPKGFKPELNYFFRLQNRATSLGISSTVWPRNAKGFLAFLKEIGPMPTKMDRPSVGRKDHSKGYEPGNVFWQELLDNKKHTDPVSLERISASNRRSWNDPESRKKRIIAAKLSWKDPEVRKRRIASNRGKKKENWSSFRELDCFKQKSRKVEHK